MKPEYYDNDVIEFDENKVIIKREIELPKGKTTSNGEYPKLKKDGECAYPKRADCNNGLFYRRCKYMKCLGLGKWICIYKNGKK